MAAVLRADFEEAAAAAAAAASAGGGGRPGGAPGGGHGSVTAAEDAAWTAAMNGGGGGGGGAAAAAAVSAEDQGVSDAEWAQVLSGGGGEAGGAASGPAAVTVEELEQPALLALLTAGDIDVLLLEVWPVAADNGGGHCCRPGELELALAGGKGRTLGLLGGGAAPPGMATVEDELLRTVVS